MLVKTDGTTIVIVLGRKTTSSGKIDPVHVALVSHAIHIAEEEQAVLVLTGGKTRGGVPLAEAELALALIPENLRERTLVETVSKTTAENIIFAKNWLLVGTEIKKMIIVTTHPHEARVRLMLAEHWPEILPVVEFNGIAREVSFRQRAVHYILYLITRIDPKERLIAPLVYLLRNGKTT